MRAGAIALMGWRHGGSTVLAAADPPGFAGFVAFSPDCSRTLRAGSFAPAAPLLLLTGEADDWAPPGPCRALAERAGPVVPHVGYPGTLSSIRQGDQRIAG